MNNKSWEDLFEKYKRPFEVESEPENFIHVGLNPNFSHFDLIKDISQTIEKELTKVLEELDDYYGGMCYSPNPPEIRQQIKDIFQQYIKKIK